MGAAEHRKRRFESAVSTFLLMVLFFIGVGVLIKQKPKPHKSQEIPDLTALTPTSFKVDSKTEVYNPANLYEKIDGKAPQYTESGFVKLFTQRFVSAGDQDLMAELYLYDMGKPRNAFSVYSVQRRADAQILPNVQFGYKTSNGLYFVHGKYYVELVGYSQSQQLLDLTERIAQALKKKLPAARNTDIPEINLFPSRHFVRGSVKLYLENALGFEGLTDTFTGQYKIDGQPVTAFLSRRSDAQDARSVAKSYCTFLLENGATPIQTQPQSDKTEPFNIFNFYGTTEIVFVSGPVVAGVHEADNQQIAIKLAQILFKELDAKTKTQKL